MEESRSTTDVSSAGGEDKPDASAGGPTAGEPAAAGTSASRATGGASEVDDDAFGWDTDTDADRATGKEWMAQLQSMIEGLASQAAPVARAIGAKAAELAAIAGDKAGPIAHKAAEATEQAGARIAERSREVAADLRREQHASTRPPGDTTASNPPGTSGEPPAS
jgi:hypothetical protein